ncbi:MAG TPA: helix-turn-helix transcriptional regulator [Verrucomicrobiae bacterium]|nr:helix-turn-helix transcriptional regulator [Verrucomicrobiae bacterium]
MASRLDHVHDWNKVAADAHFSVSKLAKECGVSERQLRRYFLKQFGKSPREWMAAQRMRKVRPLLATGKSVKEIAAQAGFNHQSNFARSFKHYYNATPSSQRRAA